MLEGKGKITKVNSMEILVEENSFGCQSKIYIVVKNTDGKRFCIGIQKEFKAFPVDDNAELPEPTLCVSHELITKTLFDRIKIKKMKKIYTEKKIKVKKLQDSEESIINVTKSKGE